MELQSYWSLFPFVAFPPPSPGHRGRCLRLGAIGDLREAVPEQMELASGLGLGTVSCQQW